MHPDENIEKIKATLAAAFPPFRWVTQILDYDRALRFKVLDNDGQCIIQTKTIPLRLLMDDLESVVEDTKAEIRLRRPDFP